MDVIDQTHDAALQSWVASANGHQEFPIQNLPFGVFSPDGGATPRGGVAIGDMVFDLSQACDAGLFGDVAATAKIAAEPRLNKFFGLPKTARLALRRRLSEVLAVGFARKDEAARSLRPATDCTMLVPARIGDFTDFYVGINHAKNVGKLFRPETPLMPNYKYVPIAYHGRSSSVVMSGTGVRRPTGQSRPGGQGEPMFGPCRNLDYELEVAFWVGEGNDQGYTIPIADAARHIVGYSLLNDWSARDIQAWEYQPLGPFLAKNFASTISPWVVTAEALAPFRTAQSARVAGDPRPLSYLWNETDQATGAYDIELEVLLLTSSMRARGIEPQRIALSNTRHMYWTFAQMLTHHASNGCNLRPGDLIGSGTISTPDVAGVGSLLERTENGTRPLVLATGEERRLLRDGDEIIMRGHAGRAGFATIGFGECRGVVLPAQPIASDIVQPTGVALGVD